MENEHNNVIQNLTKSLYIDRYSTCIYNMYILVVYIHSIFLINKIPRKIPKKMSPISQTFEKKTRTSSDQSHNHQLLEFWEPELQLSTFHLRLLGCPESLGRYGVKGFHGWKNGGFFQKKFPWKNPQKELGFLINCQLASGSCDHESNLVVPKMHGQKRWMDLGCVMYFVPIFSPGSIVGR